ncbi:hypothetical protein ACFO5X_04700 [Seohaeicola nanhaiensis]|uniref:Uncharacterized protein n=1 Tax=Seohaeicola nanhaiensis TaxID=1387282 RepID=A0ABV9KCX6_9RHOB
MAGRIFQTAALRILVVVLGGSLPALAAANDVPRMPDGKVDVDAVMSSFHAGMGLTRDGPAGDIDGEFLGEPFHAQYEPSADPLTYVWSIQSEGLSEEAVYLAAVLLAGLICDRDHHRPVQVNWSDTSVKIGGGWRVLSTCSREQPKIGN